MRNTTLWLLSTLIAATAFAQAPVQENDDARAALDATGFQGTTLIYDLRADTYIAGHRERVDDRQIPASTFKIFSSLAALETGVVPDLETIIPWDGVTRNRKELNRDMNLRQAFLVSALPHYQHLVREIGEERMNAFIHDVGYGNRDTSGGADLFWIRGGLRISPREQIEFLHRLYRGDLPFSKETMATVRQLMMTEEGDSEDNDSIVIRAKTGWAIPDDSKNIGWWVGWVEKGEDVFFFATVLQSGRPAEGFGETRKKVTREILRKLGILDTKS